MTYSTAKKGYFLDTPSSRKLTSQIAISSVPVLAEGVFVSEKEVLKYLGHSRFISERHMENLREYCLENGHDAELRCGETDPTGLMEGLYIKIEEDGCVKNRLIYVRASFSQAVDASGTHWIDRPIVTNGLSVSL